MLRNVPICLNCARRFVSPKRPGTKYSPLSDYLAWRARYNVFATLTFAKIESIIGANLPSSALQDTHWWNNASSRTQAQAWMNIGWRVNAVNLNDRTVTFKRIASSKTETHKKRRKRTPSSAAKTFRPPKPQQFRRRIPSKTRMAKAWARLKNVERKKVSMRRYRGKFKPRTAFEKKLYKPEAKPDK